MFRPSCLADVCHVELFLFYISGLLCVGFPLNVTSYTVRNFQRIMKHSKHPLIRYSRGIISMLCTVDG